MYPSTDSHHLPTNITAAAATTATATDYVKEKHTKLCKCMYFLIVCSALRVVCVLSLLIYNVILVLVTVPITHTKCIAHPTSRSLTLIEWRNEQGERKIFRLKQLICHKWKELGCLLDIPLSVLHSWEKYHREDPMDSVNAVLSHWLENPTEYYPKSWEGLDRLLDNAELGQVAEDLKQARNNAL